MSPDRSTSERKPLPAGGSQALPQPAEPATTDDRKSQPGPDTTGPYVPPRVRLATGGELPDIPGFEVLSVIAHGGMGYVLKARRKLIDGLVAIKLPLLGPDQLDRFLREAHAATSLRHRNICRIYHADLLPDGTPYLVMEYLDGGTLREQIHQQPPTNRDAARTVAVLARAIAHAHEHGIIHRDLKPANVLLDDKGEPLVTDFGLAKQLGGTGDAQLTATGQVMGTPAYMPPEQAAGHTDEVGPLADVYALGAILYELLTGQPPFTGTSGEVLRKVQTEEPVPPSRLRRVDRDLETISLKCLAKRPPDRYASAVELAEDLERYGNGDPIRARRLGLATRLLRRVRRSPLQAALVAGLLVATAASAWGGVAWYRQRAINVAEQAISAAQPAEDRKWNEEDLQILDSLVADLGRRDRQRGDQATARIQQALIDSAQRRLQLPVLQADDERYVERVIGWLESREADPAVALRTDLDRRRRSWQPTFVLTPGQPDAAVFPPAAAPNGPRYGPDEIKLGAPTTIQPLPLHVTAVPCRGPVRLEARFAPGWDRGDTLGLILNHIAESAGSGYAVVLRPALPPDPKRPPPTFAQARAEGAAIQLQVVRNGQVVREQRIPAAGLPPGPLSVVWQRSGDEVLAQVNQLPPTTYRDLFPLSGRGVFGMVAPAGLSLLSLEGKRQPLAVQPSPLERGDELFLAGNYLEALAFYQHQLAITRGALAGEARFKEALALLSLGRQAEATERFEKLYLDKVKDWAPLAGCYLLAAHVRGREMDRANALLEQLAVDFAEHDPGDLAARLPEELRTAILHAYRQTAGGLGLLRRDPKRVGQIDRLLRVEEVLRVDPDYRGWTRITMLRALRIEPDPAARQEAIRRTRAWLQDYPPDDHTTPFGILLTNEYGWLMREVGKPEEGLREVERRLLLPQNRYRPEALPLLIEQARLHAALQEWSRAERDLEEWLTATAATNPPYRLRAEVCLMLGLLRERRGDAGGAVATWRQGLTPRGLSDPGLFGHTAGGIGAAVAVSLHALTDTLDADDLEGMARNALAGQPGGAVLGLLLRKDDVRHAVALARTSVTKAEARNLLWQIAFQTVGLRDSLRSPTLFIGVELLRDLAFGGDGRTTAEQEKHLAAVVVAVVDGFLEGRLSGTQLMQLAITLRGSRDLFNWGRLEGTLSPAVRGPVAWLLGHRFGRLNKPADALAFFRLAVKDTPDNAPLRKLAQAEVDRLAGGTK